MAVEQIIEGESVGTMVGKLNANIKRGIAASGGDVSEAEAALKSRFIAATQSASRYTYIVAGDSTRDAPDGRAMPYYIEQCAKINFDVVDNATSGQTLSDWLNNVDDTTLQQAIDATPGTGITTIMELSLGINDYTDGGASSAASIKADLIAGIAAYLSAKPDAIVYLVSPIKTWRDDAFFETIYEEVAAEQGLFLVSGYNAMVDTYPDTTWYADTTHPHWYGSMRLVNFIFDKALPPLVKAYMWITDKPALGQNLPALTVSNGFWVTSTGAWSATTTWRATQKIPVDPSSVLTITHNGNRMDCLMYDEDGNFIKNTQKMTDIYLTPRTYFVAFNISSEGATWDGLSETPVVVYSANFTIYPYINQKLINDGLAIGLPYRRTATVDRDGLTGTVGQTQISNGDGTWSWG